MRKRVLVLDAMGVIYRSADDVAELLVPFVREHGGSRDTAYITREYRCSSLGRMSSAELWQNLGVSPTLEDEYLAGHSLSPGFRNSCKSCCRTSTPCGAFPTMYRNGPKSCVNGMNLQRTLQDSSSAAMSEYASPILPFMMCCCCEWVDLHTNVSSSTIAWRIWTRRNCSDSRPCCSDWGRSIPGIGRFRRLRS